MKIQKSRFWRFKSRFGVLSLGFGVLVAVVGFKSRFLRLRRGFGCSGRGFEVFKFFVPKLF